MSKVKKVLAMILSMAMILGMSLTAFAAESNKIVVNNLEEGTTVKAVQVIVPATGTETGWDFVNNDNIKRAYVTKLLGDETSVTPDNCQKAIWMLLLAQTPGLADQEDVLHIDIPDDIKAATPEEIKNALTAIPDREYTTLPDEGSPNEFTVTSAGIYAIKATPAGESDTVYNPMAAYVAFEYNEDGTPTLPDDNTVVNAKKTEVPVEKEVIDGDKATGISETVTYRVTTSVPFGVAEWKFTDRITGADYVVEPEGTPHAGQVKVSVKVGTNPAEDKYATVNDNSFELDLTSLLNADNQGADVVFTYQAVVTGLEVNNEIKYDDSHTSDEVKLYTGSIEFTKYDENKQHKLGGAGFKVSRTLDNTTEYAVFNLMDDGTYQLVSWVANIDNATEVFTNNNSKDLRYGTLTITGLDWGTYHFTETTAPEGYTINEEGKDVTFDQFTDGVAKEAFGTKGDMTDTKLSSLPLPETGGMGTTIFTIGGCAIMIAAAGLFFASRKKESK